MLRWNRKLVCFLRKTNVSLSLEPKKVRSSFNNNNNNNNNNSNNNNNNNNNNNTIQLFQSNSYTKTGPQETIS